MDDSKSKKGCNCKKSKCLKLYCECFSSQGFCSKECKCVNCYNQEKFKDIRDLVIQETKEKNPYAFTNKFKYSKNKNEAGTGKDTTLHIRGCNCKKTNCRKKYCECFVAGVPCTNLCKCKYCENEKKELNEEETKIYLDKMNKRRKKRNLLDDFFFKKYEILKKLHD